jgi:hypothetical protein
MEDVLPPGRGTTRGATRGGRRAGSSGVSVVPATAGPSHDADSTKEVLMSKDVVARYQAALSSGDLETARRLLNDDLRFKGPFDTFQTADEYWKAIQGLRSIVDSVDVQHISSDGDQVVVLYDMVTNTPAGTQLVCEWYGVDGNKIAWIRALFDSAPFAFLRSASA